MAPAASKRRKRATVLDDSEDEFDDDYSTDQQAKKSKKNTNTSNNTSIKGTKNDNKNTIQRFLFSSPDAKRQTQPPSPHKATAAIGLEDDPSSASLTPLRKQHAATTRGTAAAAAPKPPSYLSTVSRSPSKSPIKRRTRAGRKAAAAAAASAEDKGKGAGGKKHADLRTLFSRQAQSQAAAPPKSKKEAQLVDDIISDPILEDDSIQDTDDDDVPLARSSSTQTSLAGKGAGTKQQRKGFRGAGKGSFPGSPTPQGKIAGGRFLLKSQQSPPSQPLTQSNAQPAAKPADEKDARPWSDRFAPWNLEELAVHKKKVADVRKWLEDVYGGRLRQRLLILKGHAGTGKTTTIQLLAKDLKCEVLEWRNPVNNFVGGQAYQSAAAQFEEFLGRGGKFGQLDVEGEEEKGDMPPPPLPGSTAGNISSSEKKLILIEEFPNTFVRSSTALVAFRNSLLHYLAANMPSGMMSWGRPASSEPITPIVMVISETLLTTASASADSFTAHRLLGQEIMRHPGTAVIEFNPVAPTLLAKALELIVQKEARESGRRRTPGPLVLQQLGEIGDIRSAVSSLEFLCVKGDDDADWGSKVTFTKTKRSKDTPSLTKGEQESLELISRREATLGIFHAVGKVVYNKREGPKPAAEVLPSHLAHLARPIPSQVSVDSLMDETGTDTHTFISALHENYALSCERTGPLDENSSLDYLNGCLDSLSESDLLCPSQDIFFGGGKGYGGGFIGKDSGSHILRQDEMAFQVAVRGLLFSLPYPVKRSSHPTAGGGGGGAHKMFYPTYLKLWRSKEEIAGLADLWATKLLKNEDIGPGPPPGASTQSALASSKNHGNLIFSKPPGSQFSPSKPKSSHKPQNHAPPSPLSLGNVTRNELLLERLPYMAQIARAGRSPSGMQRVKDLDRIVAFSGIGPPGASEEDGEDAEEDSGATREAANSWATDRPNEEATPRKKRGLGALLQGRSSRIDNGNGEEELQSLPLESLVISDDDIEDD
ncbi:Rad17 cell cycle checkpoint protein-domain-containing protein [Podospora australis]|uniref:Rad17 cell cycle checkpoint protein-domain-containing protein n=1 Tax=Podospora australis TaxID=1536484 RepID=A0AAN6WXJ2_9PEZI|nr:Rad17 cell cycle checkpoint protein-domain-containing protein [Podospora australis]